MGKIAIVTDSTSAISQAEAADLGDVFVVPITVNINGQSYREGIDITNKQFYDTLATLKNYQQPHHRLRKKCLTSMISWLRMAMMKFSVFI
ncbi:DegV family protein [Lentilactobacillus kosonis]|uniref:DegV family protein n=1 Tax=Lentilactobacillus kosonis TaxID=2810561 RepID=A0A401FJ82_9LACO|nr:DegV family protein [Lentilactobacillus kosonis]